MMQPSVVTLLFCRTQAWWLKGAWFIPKALARQIRWSTSSVFRDAPIARFVFKVAAASSGIVFSLPEGHESTWIDGRDTDTIHCWCERPLDGGAALLVYEPHVELVDIAAAAAGSDMSEVGVGIYCRCCWCLCLHMLTLRSLGQVHGGAPWGDRVLRRHSRFFGRGFTCCQLCRQHQWVIAARARRPLAPRFI
jgi:hypothetical protein